MPDDRLPPAEDNDDGRSKEPEDSVYGAEKLAEYGIEDGPIHNAVAEIHNPNAPANKRPARADRTSKPKTRMMD